MLSDLHPAVLAGAAVLLVVNVVTAVAYAWDKHLAGSQRRRVPEKTLIGLGLLGGWPAAWLTMSLVRHKTRKLSFQLPLAAVTAVWLVGGAAVWWWQSGA